MPVWDGEMRLFFLLNHDGGSQNVHLAGRFRDELTEAEYEVNLTLQPYAVPLLRRLEA